jgi:hypothetical protein
MLAAVIVCVTVAAAVIPDGVRKEERGAAALPNTTEERGGLVK